MTSAIVQPGQSLWDIAVQYAGSAQAAFQIAQANGLGVSDLLTPGQVLQIPEVLDKRARRILADYLPASEGETPAPGMANWPIVRLSSQEMTGGVVVQAGQSLWDIALQYAGSAEAAFQIAQVNGRSISAELTAGQTLIIPAVLNAGIVSEYQNSGYVPASAVPVEELLEGIDYWAIEIEFEVQ
jgi:nucleoid-associated protein YgaU